MKKVFSFFQTQNSMLMISFHVLRHSRDCLDGDKILYSDSVCVIYSLKAVWITFSFLDQCGCHASHHSSCSSTFYPNTSHVLNPPPQHKNTKCLNYIYIRNDNILILYNIYRFKIKPIQKPAPAVSWILSELRCNLLQCIFFSRKTYIFASLQKSLLENKPI